MENTEKKLNLLIKEYELFLKYFRAKFPLFYNSNIFLSDIQYGIMHYMGTKSYKVNFEEASKISENFIDFLIKKQILTPSSEHAWKMNDVEFVTKKSGDPL